MRIIMLAICSFFLLIAPSSAHDSSAVAVDGDPANRVVHALPGAGPVMAAGEAGLIALVDGSWTRIADAPPAGHLVVADTDPPVMLAGDQLSCMKGGEPAPLMRSEDGGLSWDEVDGVAGVRPLAMWPDSGFALGSDCIGLMQSTDFGLTWSLVEGLEPGWDVTSFAAVPDASTGGPVVLVARTSEGGTTHLVSIDFSDIESPVISDRLLEYYAIGGLAGWGDTYVVAVMNGVWISDDAGQSWTRTTDGLSDVTLDYDPLTEGLPADFEPGVAGLYSVAFLPGDGTGLVVGSVNGVYLRADAESPFGLVDGTSGTIWHLALTPDAMNLLYLDIEAGVHLRELHS